MLFMRVRKEMKPMTGMRAEADFIMNPTAPMRAIQTMETMKVMRTNVYMEPCKHDVSQGSDETHFCDASRKEGVTHVSYTSHFDYETHELDASHRSDGTRRAGANHVDNGDKKRDVSQALHETRRTDASHKNNEARGFNVSQELGETH